MEMNNLAREPSSLTAAPHGPLTRAVATNVLTNFPFLSIIRSEPGWTVAEVPSAVGKLPTMT